MFIGFHRWLVPACEGCCAASAAETARVPRDSSNARTTTARASSSMLSSSSSNVCLSRFDAPLGPGGCAEVKCGWVECEGKGVEERMASLGPISV